MLPRSSSAALLLLGVLSPLAVSCGGGAGSDSAAAGTTVAVTADDESCDLARTEFDAGALTFAVSNEGSSTTEVYVYGEDGGAYDRVIGEVENIGPGTSRDLAVDLPAGSYEVACKPGQAGDGIRTPITVSGEGGDAAAEEGYDREIELATDGSTISGLEGGATTGERIEFKLRNDADGSRTLELKDPAGDVAGEVQVDQGATGKVVVELADAGTWQVVVEGDGVEDIAAELPVA